MSDTGAAAELPRYRCHKEVGALKITAVIPTSDGGAIIEPSDPGYGQVTVRSDYVKKHKPEAGGYYVVYKDGYKSYSPAEAFEDGYTRL